VTDHFGLFPSELEAEIRRYVARYCKVEDATFPTSWVLHGVPVTFYRNAWFGYMQRPGRDGAGPGTPLYFVLQVGRRQKIRHLFPIANAPGAIARVNRDLKVSLTKDNFLQYLRYYYMFSPAAERNSPLRLGPLQYSVPTKFAHISIDDGHADAASQSKCSRECLVRGAVWRHLDEGDERFVPSKFKPAPIRPFRASGRIVLHVQDALFAVEVKVPASSGKPLLTNPELLYQGGLAEPEILSVRTLHKDERISFRELWRLFKGWTERTAGRLLRVARRLITWMLTALLAYLWAITAAFPISEAFEIPWLRRHVSWLGEMSGMPEWPHALLYMTIVALLAFLSAVIYLTNMDKIFNLIFKLFPRRWENWLARHLNPQMDKRDRDLIALDSFRKRAQMALRLLVIWTSYAVLAFASLQIALNVLLGEQSASPLQIIWSLCKQAALNIPIIVYAIIRFPSIFGNIRPVEENILHPHLLIAFHVVMAAVIVKGIHRVWLFTKEATPRAFYRRLRYHR
jgi:hypothetical protein